MSKLEKLEKSLGSFALKVLIGNAVLFVAIIVGSIIVDYQKRATLWAKPDNNVGGLSVEPVKVKPVCIDGKTGKQRPNCDKPS